MSRYWNARSSQNMKINNRSFEMLEEFKYLWTTLLHQNSIPEEIKSRLKSGIVSNHSVVQNISSTSLLSRNSKIDVQKYNFAICFVWV
jgi:restriction endonuclease